MASPEILELSYHLKRGPDDMREWWWSFPAEYRATDPREQPHRIRTLRRTDDSVDVMTYWKGPFGRDFKAKETLHRNPDGSWRADVAMMGLRIEDHFSAVPEGSGTRLTIRSTITPANLVTRVLRPVMLPGLKKSMRRTWSDAVAVCEAGKP